MTKVKCIYCHKLFSESLIPDDNSGIVCPDCVFKEIGNMSDNRLKNELNKLALSKIMVSSLEETNKNVHTKEMCKRVAELLIGAFNWRETKQGQDYWQKVYMNLAEIQFKGYDK